LALNNSHLLNSLIKFKKDAYWQNVSGIFNLVIAIF
jgi:hypothetical protein